VAHYFLAIIYRLPQDLLSSLLLHAIAALSLQERYSLVGSCKFLVCSLVSQTTPILNNLQLTLMRDTFSNGDLTREADALVELHGKQIVTALIYGVANVAPRSTIQNLSEVLHCMASRRPAQTRAYLNEILFSVSAAPTTWKIKTDSWVARFHSREPNGNTKNQRAVSRIVTCVSSGDYIDTSPF
jgi:Importin 13 repeat